MKRQRTRISKEDNEDRIKKDTNKSPLCFEKGVLEKIYKLCLLGCTDQQLADFFVVSIKTIEYWHREFPAFRETCQRGRIEADSNVANALYHRAIGYSHPDTVVLTRKVDIYDDEGNKIESRTEPLIVPIIKHYPPDSFAAHKWLTIRQRALWADSTKIDINANMQIQHLMQDTEKYKVLSEEEIALALKLGLQQALTNQN